MISDTLYDRTAENGVRGHIIKDEQIEQNITHSVRIGKIPEQATTLHPRDHNQHAKITPVEG